MAKVYILIKLTVDIIKGNGVKDRCIVEGVFYTIRKVIILGKLKIIKCLVKELNIWKMVIFIKVVFREVCTVVMVFYMGIRGNFMLGISKMVKNMVQVYY